MIAWRLPEVYAGSKILQRRAMFGLCHPHRDLNLGRRSCSLFGASQGISCHKRVWSLGCLGFSASLPGVFPQKKGFSYAFQQWHLFAVTPPYINPPKNKPRLIFLCFARNVQGVVFWEELFCFIYDRPAPPKITIPKNFPSSFGAMQKKTTKYTRFHHFEPKMNGNKIGIGMRSTN